MPNLSSAAVVIGALRVNLNYLVCLSLQTFILYPYLEKEPLSAGKALSTLALFNILSVPLVLFTLFTTAVITANVSAKRLIPYFLASEVEGMGGPLDTMQTVGTLDGDIEVWCKQLCLVDLDHLR